MDRQSTEVTHESVTGSKRRRFLSIGATGLVGLIAGCLGDDDDSTEDTDDGDDADDSRDDDDGDDDVGEPSFDVADFAASHDVINEGTLLSEVSASVVNTGDGAGEATVEYRIADVDGEFHVIDSTSVELDSFDTETVVFEDLDLEAVGPGEDLTHGIYVGDASTTGTITIEEQDPLDDPLFSFAGDPVVHGQATLGGSVSSSYGFSVKSIEIELSLPDEWEVDEAVQTIDELESFDSEDLSWSIVVPDDAVGDYDVEATVTYEEGNRDAEHHVTGSVEVLEALSAPVGINAGGISAGNDDFDDGDTVEVNGVVYEPYTADGELDSAITLLGDHGTSGANDNGFDIDGADGDAQALYQTMMHGSDIGYELLIEAGTYDVTIHLAELWIGADAGSGGDPPDDEDYRIDSYYIQDELVAEELNLWEEVGELTAYTLTTEVSLEGEPLVIQAESHERGGIINAITIESV